ncbi:Serine/threonine-protein kinase MRCK alpha [Halocaridina rubra]|uniref:Serine/threonine-protein kinase MRCK alpha n=1 Tax=Halocaridina rubra TaxID=373956 RepID=A0AAN9A5Z7_HALRR
MGDGNETGGGGGEGGGGGGGGGNGNGVGGTNVSGGGGGGELDVVNESSQALKRINTLEQLFLSGPVESAGQSYSMETLLDVLIVLYDECTNSSLRREKTVSDFIEYGSPDLTNLLHSFLLNACFSVCHEFCCQIPFLTPTICRLCMFVYYRKQ